MAREDNVMIAKSVIANLLTNWFTSIVWPKLLKADVVLVLLPLWWSETKKAVLVLAMVRRVKCRKAIRKASEAAKRDMIFVPLRDGRTLHHDVKGRHGAGKVVLRAAPPGTGIIAGGPMRAVFETVGMSDVVAKSIGTSNPYYMVRATLTH